MENINKKYFSRIYELMSFDRKKTLFEMEQKWDNLLNEAKVPEGSYVRKEIETSAKSENINKSWVEIKQEFGSNGSTKDNIMLYNAWVDKKWRPGQPIPTGFETDTHKNRVNTTPTTTTTTTNNGGVTTTTTTLAGGTTTTTTTLSNIPGDTNNDGVVDGKDTPKDDMLDNNSGKDGEDLDYDADSEGFEEEEPKMDSEIDTTRKLEITKSNNGWAEFFNM